MSSKTAWPRLAGQALESLAQKGPHAAGDVGLLEEGLRRARLVPDEVFEALDLLAQRVVDGLGVELAGVAYCLQHGQIPLPRWLANQNVISRAPSWRGGRATGGWPLRQFRSWSCRHPTRLASIPLSGPRPYKAAGFSCRRSVERGDLGSVTVTGARPYHGMLDSCIADVLHS